MQLSTTAGLFLGMLRAEFKASEYPWLREVKSWISLQVCKFIGFRFAIHGARFIWHPRCPTCAYIAFGRFQRLLRMRGDRLRALFWFGPTKLRQPLAPRR